MLHPEMRMYLAIRSSNPWRAAPLLGVIVVGLSVIVVAACGSRPDDHSAAASTGAAGAPAEPEAAPGRAAPAAAATPAPPRAEGTKAEAEAVEEAGAAARRAQPAEEPRQATRLDAMVQEMREQVGVLRAKPEPSPKAECKALHGLEDGSRKLHAAIDEGPRGNQAMRSKLVTLDMALDDLVDGRCGARPMRRSFFDDFYRALYGAFDELDALSRATPRGP
jgi:hypothetical protein